MRRFALALVLGLLLLGLLLVACSSAPTSQPEPTGQPAALRVLLSAQGASLATQAAGEELADVLAVRLSVGSVTLLHEGAPKVLATFDPPRVVELRGHQDAPLELAEAELPAGTYRSAQLRLLVVGAEVVTEGENGEEITSTLEVPSGDRSGFKINLSDVVVDETDGTTILLEFDPARSVVRTGQGRYLLRPVVQARQL